MKEPPVGLELEFTDRGFELEIKPAAQGCNSFVVVVVVATAMVGFIGFLATTLTASAVPPLVLLAVVSAGILFVFLAVLAIVFAALRASRRSLPRLILDGDTLTFPTPEGRVSIELEDVKAVDVVPIGLAVRPKRGMTHHVMLPKVNDPGRRWLDDTITAALQRHGTAAEVPESIQDLKRGERQRETS